MSAEQQAAAAAKSFRSDHDLGTQPLGDLVALIERTTGHDVAVLDAGPDEHGLTMRDPARRAVFIAVARTSSPMRQRSTLAHELAHVLFGDWTNGEELDHRSFEEIRADAFARHLLIPGDGLNAFISHSRDVTEADLSAAVQWFLVSPAMASIALYKGGYIDEATKEQWMTITTPQLATRYGWMDQYRSLQDDADRTRSPQRLLARAVSGYREGVVSVQTLATLRGIDADAVEAELAEAGVVPIEHQPPWMTAADLPPVSVDLSDLDDDGMSVV